MTAAPGDLRRTLGFTDLVMVTLGTVIGSGIFLNPAVVAQRVGTPFLTMVAWGLGVPGFLIVIWFLMSR